MIYKHQKILFEMVGGGLLNTLLLILLIKRMMQLRDIGQPKDLFLSRSIVTKMVGLVLIMVVNLMFLPLAFLSQQIWVAEFSPGAKSAFCLYYLFVTGATAYQMRTLHTEYKKKIPTEWYRHNLLWVLNTTLYMVLLLNSLTQESLLLLDVFLDSCRLLLYGFLSIYGLVYKQDIQEYESNLAQPLIYLMDRQHKRQQVSRPLLGPPSQVHRKSLSQNNTPSTPPLRFLVKDKVVHTSHMGLFAFKVEVLLQGEKHKVSKLYDDFLSFQSVLRRQLDEPLQEEVRFLPDDSPTDFSSQVQHIQAFLDSFGNCPRLVSSSFLDFMQFPPEARLKLGRKQASKSFQLEEGKVVSPEEREEGEEEWQHFFWVQHLESVTDEHQVTNFKFSITQAQPPQERWVIQKRFNDFRQLVKELHQGGVQDVLALPSLIFNQRRGFQLQTFLRLLLNHPKYMSAPLQDFLGVTFDLRAYAKTVRPSCSLAVSVEDTLSQQEGDRLVKYFRLQVNELGASREVVNVRTLQRRFKEFYKFKQMLQQIYGRTQSFSSFPSKLNKNSAYRQTQLQLFLQEVADLPGLSRSYLYLKFFQVRAKTPILPVAPLPSLPSVASSLSQEKDDIFIDIDQFPNKVQF